MVPARDGAVSYYYSLVPLGLTATPNLQQFKGYHESSCHTAI